MNICYGSSVLVSDTTYKFKRNIGLPVFYRLSSQRFVTVITLNIKNLQILQIRCNVFILYLATNKPHQQDNYEYEAYLIMCTHFLV